MSDVFILAFCQSDDCVLPCFRSSPKTYESKSDENVLQTPLHFETTELNSSLKTNQNSSEFGKMPDTKLPSSNSDTDGNNVSLNKDQTFDHESRLPSNTEIIKSVTRKCNESDNMPSTSGDKKIRVVDEYSSNILNNGELLSCVITSILLHFNEFIE